MSTTKKSVPDEELQHTAWQRYITSINPMLAVPEENDSPLKGFLINFTGEKMQPEDGKVTVNMIAETVAAEFPEFIFTVAEENFLRGYQLGLNDATTFTTETENAETPTTATETVTGNEE
jgi:hypothetical protein